MPSLWMASRLRLCESAYRTTRAGSRPHGAGCARAAVAARLHPAAERRRRCGGLHVCGCLKSPTGRRVLMSNPPKHSRQVSMCGRSAVAARLHPAAERRRRCGGLRVCGCLKSPSGRRALKPNPHEAVRAKCRCVAARLWLRACIQQRSDVAAVYDFKSAAV